MVQRYIRTFFDYDASRDSLLPTGDVGMSFRAGDVLELVDDQDPNWWQVNSVKFTQFPSLYLCEFALFCSYDAADELSL